MKVVILAGGLGTRLSEETHSIPKPMVSIGERPILWHIMKIYSSFGFNDFVVLAGYKSYVIKEYFANYLLHQSDVEFSLDKSTYTILNSRSENWKVTVLDTGLTTQTAGRIKKAERYLNDERFFLTYGDGLSDININDLLRFHHSHGNIATVTAVRPESRFGALNITNDNRVSSFIEKPMNEGGWINGGFMVLEPEIFNYLDHCEEMPFEDEPLKKLSKNLELVAFLHNGFWKPMDTIRDRNQLEHLWKEGSAPWKKWQ